MNRSFQLNWPLTISLPLRCSFIRFALRFMTHYLFLTPKPEAIKLPFPTRPAFVAAIVFPNIICILFHLFAVLPKGSETSHGYLHGGVLVDFIGQVPPKLRISFLLIDFLILGFQAFMYAVHEEREAIRLNIGIPNLLDLSLQRSLGFTLLQNYDAEERGVRRGLSESREPGDEENGIEMGLLSRLDGLAPLEQSRDDGHPSPSESPNRPRSHVDIFASGNGFLGEFHVLRTLGRAATSQGIEPSSVSAFGESTSFARFVAQRRAQLRRG
jgi:hypothetical protein